MVELITLGTLTVRGPDGRELHGLVAQPKRFALLAYLCLATPRGFHQREALLGLFWPEADEFHARAALRKSLHVVRHAVGNDAILSRGEDQIGVAFDEISCDAAEFEDLVRSGRLEEALDRYRGDLLPGFYVDGAPEFERWLECERSRLRGLAAKAAQQLTERLESAQRLEEAVAAARTALALAGADERALRRLLVLLDKVGDRAGAMVTYDAFVKHIAEGAGVRPSPETQALVRRICANHDLIVGNVARAAIAMPDAARVRSESTGSPPPGASEGRRWNWRIAIVVSGWAMAVVGVLISLGAWRRESRTPATDVGVAPLGVGRRSLAIAPNGRRFVYASRQGSTTRLYLREIDELDARSLPGTDGAYQPFFSPDGEWVGFFTGSTLKKVSLRGDQPITLAAIAEPFGAVWGPNDRILVVDRHGNGLVWVPASGGRPERATRR